MSKTIPCNNGRRGAAAKEEEDTQIPLRNWINIPDNNSITAKESIIRKATVAYGIVELLIRCPNNNGDSTIGTDNFEVRFCNKAERLSSWNDIRGVSMISSGLSLSIEESSYLSYLFDHNGGETDGQMGRYLEVELDGANAKNCSGERADADGTEIGKHRSHCLLAKLISTIYSQMRLNFQTIITITVRMTSPPSKKQRKRHFLSAKLMPSQPL